MLELAEKRAEESARQAAAAAVRMSMAGGARARAAKESATTAALHASTAAAQMRARRRALPASVLANMYDVVNVNGDSMINFAEFLWFALSVKQSCVMACRPLKEEVTSRTARAVHFLLEESNSVRARQITQMRLNDVMQDDEIQGHGSPESKTAQPDDDGT